MTDKSILEQIKDLRNKIKCLCALPSLTIDDLKPYQLTSEKGQPNGYAPLNNSSQIDSQYLPSYVDDVLEFANLASFPTSGESGKIYVAIDSSLQYRWGGSIYVPFSGGTIPITQWAESTTTYGIYYADSLGGVNTVGKVGIGKDPTTDTFEVNGTLSFYIPNFSTPVFKMYSNGTIGKVIPGTSDANNNFVFGKNAGLYGTGNSNVILGDFAMATVNGSNNTIIGYSSGQGVNNSLANFNVAIGTSTSLSVASQNAVVIGNNARSSGDYNTAIGAYAGFNSTSGANCIFLGNRAGQVNTGNNNIIISSQTGTLTTGLLTSGTNNIILSRVGNTGITTGSGNIVIGNVVGLSAALANTMVFSNGVGTERFRIDSNGYFGLGTVSPVAKLDVALGLTTLLTAINATGQIDDFLQYNIKNTSTGTKAQSGYAATANNGTDTTGFAWMGINNSNFNFPTVYNIGVGNDVTYIGSGQDMHIANANNTKSIIFSTGKAVTPFFDERMRITNSGSIGIGTATPVTTAILDVSSTTKGVLLPRMTLAQRNAIVSPVIGLMIFNMTRNELEWFDGQVWLNRTLVKKQNVSGSTVTAGMIVRQSISTINGVTATTVDADNKVVGVVVDGNLVNNGIITVQITGETSVLCTGTVNLADFIYSTTTIGIGRGAASAASGALLIANGQRNGAGNSLISASFLTGEKY